jgi:ribose transport system substrate-binding protein
MSVESFATSTNLLSSMRNCAFVGLIALGATVVIVSGGIDLSVGSVMGLSAVVTASLMNSGVSMLGGVSAGLGTGIACGLMNGAIIAYARVSPFVVTLGMLSIARSLAVVISNNRTLFELGPDQDLFLAIGAGKLSPVIVLFSTLFFLVVALYRTPWGNYVHALGSNEEAAHRTGISVNLVKLSVYTLSSLLAALAGILMLAWLGSVSSSLGTGAELTVIAATVIGGTQLSGGAGSLWGAIIGAALLETIRNGLTLSGINPYWQGTFVGACIICAVAIDTLKHRLSATGIIRRCSYGAALVGIAAICLMSFFWIRLIPNEENTPPPERSPKRTFAVVPKFMNHPFFEAAKQGCTEAANEMSNTECLFIGPSEPNEQAQIQILQDLISKKVAGIAVAPANSSAVGRLLRGAHEASIPIVTWDSDLLAIDKTFRSTYVGTENYALGLELGALAAKLRPSGGTFAMISGGAAAENLNERMKGVRDTLASLPFQEVAGTPLFCNDDSALAVQQLEDILGKYPNLNVVISLGAWPLSVQHAYRLVAERYRNRIDSRELVILSADTLPMQLKIVADGLAHGLVGQRPFEMGYRVMQVLRDVIDGSSVQDPLYTGLDVCLPDNISQCLNGKGLKAGTAYPVNDGGK